MPRFTVSEIPLSQILPCEDNPNRHDKGKISALAANIQRFGLIHPITIRKIPRDESAIQMFEIVSGEGRFRAFQELKRDAIPAVVVEPDSEVQAWGLRLSENKLRSFDWVAECKSFAEMKRSGEVAKGLAKVFGLTTEEVTRRCAVGEVLRRASVDPGVNAEYKDIKEHILPLRIPKHSPTNATEHKKGFQPSNPDDYDYSETTQALKLLASGELSRQELPSYSLERRQAIAETQRDRLIEEAAKAKTQEAESKAQRAIEAAEGLAARHLKAKEELQEKLRKQAEEHKNQLDEVRRLVEEAKGSSEEQTAKYQRQIMDLQGKLAGKQGDIQRLEDNIESLRSQIEEEIRKEVEATVREEVRSEHRRERKSEAQRDIDRQKKQLENERARLNAERDQVEREKRKAQRSLKEAQEIHNAVEDHKKRAAKLTDMQGWIKEFNRRGDEYLDMLGTANANDYWALTGPSEWKRIAGAFHGVLEESEKAMTTLRNMQEQSAELGDS